MVTLQNGCVSAPCNSVLQRVWLSPCSVIHNLIYMQKLQSLYHRAHACKLYQFWTWGAQLHFPPNKVLQLKKECSANIVWSNVKRLNKQVIGMIHLVHVYFLYHTSIWKPERWWWWIWGHMSQPLQAREASAFGLCCGEVFLTFKKTHQTVRISEREISTESDSKRVSTVLTLFCECDNHSSKFC